MNTKLRVLCVSSSGGHWVQLKRVKQAFEDCDLFYASTEKDYSQSVIGSRFSYVPDASIRSSKLRILWQALCVLGVIIKVRPDVVVSTGAAPGFFAILFAKMLGKKTIWIDSIANVHQISLAGEKALRYVDLFITQWEHLAGERGLHYYGSVV
ncbi:MAG: hypothetical protein KTR17_01290 [Cellvibrionaceae bacterium]|nr:hypothetical protein [Cellvibrionaceae bacterium]